MILSVKLLLFCSSSLSLTFECKQNQYAKKIVDLRFEDNKVGFNYSTNFKLKFSDQSIEGTKVNEKRWRLKLSLTILSDDFAMISVWFRDTAKAVLR